ncbi:MAG: DUF4238 domain-containing protein [Chloroflexi bacterium]|nr:DUF4238 domain-containing protein [Chloroflexota bacterium]
MQKTKRQHYVPQFYLRKFSEDGNSIFVFDKVRRAIFNSSIINVAQERYFFDLPEEVTGDEDPQIVEQVFAELETTYASLLDKLLQALVRKRRFNPKYKIQLAFFISIQFLRTREYRQNQAQLRKAIVDVINQEFAKEGMWLEYGYKDEAVNHFISLFNPKLVEALTEVLLKHIWVIWNNKTEHPFYTSDNPVVVASRIQKSAGFASPGVEILLPLNSKLLLSICEKNYFSNLSSSDCKVRNLYDDAQVKYYNRLQVINAFRQVYCSSQHFSLAEEVCEQTPNLCDPNRQRVEVEQYGDIIKFSFK